jgi:hypothetical protein
LRLKVLLKTDTSDGTGAGRGKEKFSSTVFFLALALLSWTDGSVEEDSLFFRGI